MSGSGASAGIGLIGCGYAARTRHLPALARVTEARVVAVSDLDVAAAEETASEWGVPRVHGSAAELLADPQVDAVAVCVPAASHVEVALAALEARRHVFIEKPLALSLTEADRLIERARGSEVKTMVGFNMRWHGMVRRAREAVRRGALGRIQCVRTVHGGQAVGSRENRPEWRSSRVLGGGALLEKAVHHFDLWRLLTGDEVEDVVAVSESGAEDDAIVSVTARMRTGAVAAGVAADVTTSTNRVELYGDRATLELCLYRLDGMTHSSLTDLPGAPRTRLKRVVEGVRQVGGGLPSLRGGGAYDSSYSAQWRHFLRTIRTGEAPECGLEDGRRALAIALAAAQSASSGRRVRVSEAPTEVTAAAARA